MLLLTRGQKIAEKNFEADREVGFNYLPLPWWEGLGEGGYFIKTTFCADDLPPLGTMKYTPGP